MSNETEISDTFKAYNLNFKRGIYTLTTGPYTWLAKVSVIYDRRSAHLESIGCHRGHNIETAIYEQLSMTDKCDILSKCMTIIQEDISTKYMFKVNDKSYVLDFTEMIRIIEQEGEEHYGYSIFIVEKDPGYTMMYDNLPSYNNNTMERIIINVMKKCLYLNEKYSFIHGDLKTDNIMIDNDLNIKLIDFDMSSIHNKYSQNQQYYVNHQVISGMNKHKGFLFDFYRLYISLYLWNVKGLFADVEIIKKINKIMDRCLEIYKRVSASCPTNIFNNPEYFCEWLLDDEITYENIVNFINSYEISQ